MSNNYSKIEYEDDWGSCTLIKKEVGISGHTEIYKIDSDGKCELILIQMDDTIKALLKLLQNESTKPITDVDANLIIKAKGN